LVGRLNGGRCRVYGEMLESSGLVSNRTGPKWRLRRWLNDLPFSPPGNQL